MESGGNLKGVKYDEHYDLFLGKWLQPAQKYLSTYCEECPEQAMTSAVPSLDEFMLKVVVWMCFPLQGWRKTFIVEIGSVDALDCCSQY